MDVTSAGPRRLLTRLTLTGQGLARIGFGIARGLFGVLTRNVAQRANGARNVYRGAGLVSGAWGHTHVEYARKN